MFTVPPRAAARRFGVRRRSSWPAVVGLVPAVLLSLVSCSSEPATAPAGPVVIAVPADAATIGEAVARARTGDLVLVSPGTYPESVTIATPGITVRGTDRNTVIIDGQGLRAQGVLVIADNVRVQNLTVTSHTFNGVLVTGQHDGATASAHGVDGYQTLDPAKYPPIQGFAIDNVTATNNGLYGLYAFNSQHGSISNSYASGSADSGIYVGQCQQCDIVVSGNVAERNAIGFENANASDSVVISGNRFSGNRVGMTLISNYQEAFQPQHGNTVVGNLVADNSGAQTPAQADGAFGLGLGIAGGQDNLMQHNTFSGNPYAGVVIRGTEDIAATGNSLKDNTFSENGVDAADLSSARSPSAGNCLSGNTISRTQPAPLATTGCPNTAPATAGADASAMPQLKVPAGISFLKVPLPPAQPGLIGDPTVIPPALPSSPAVPAAVTTAPDASLLADRVLAP